MDKKLTVIDLRVGGLFNIINRNNPVHLPGKEVIQIITIGFSEVQYCFDYENPAMVPHDWFKASIRDLSPIRLSEDYLLKMHFKKEEEKKLARSHNDYSFCLHHKSLNGFKEDAYFMGVRYDDCGTDPHTVHYFTYDIKYVHQLQSIFYDLTEVEVFDKY
jgi:hypothetical protein